MAQEACAFWLVPLANKQASLSYRHNGNCFYYMLSSIILLVLLSGRSAKLVGLVVRREKLREGKGSVKVLLWGKTQSL